MIDILTTLVDAVNGSLAGNGLANSSLSFLAGLWLGYRLDLHKARRVEFNAATASLRDELKSALQHPGRYRLWREPGQLADITDRMALLQRYRFTRAWDEYQREYKAGQRENQLGEALFEGDETRLAAPMRRLLHLVRLQ